MSKGGSFTSTRELKLVDKEFPLIRDSDLEQVRPRSLDDSYGEFEEHNSSYVQDHNLQRFCRGFERKVLKRTEKLGKAKLAKHAKEKTFINGFMGLKLVVNIHPSPPLHIKLLIPLSFPPEN
jgi:hypothetical protein